MTKSTMPSQRSRPAMSTPFDVRDGRQHLAIAPNREGRHDVGRVAMLEAMLKAMLEALEAGAELAELREDDREGPSESVHPFQNR